MAPSSRNCCEIQRADTGVCGSELLSTVHVAAGVLTLEAAGSAV